MPAIISLVSNAHRYKLVWVSCPVTPWSARSTQRAAGQRRLTLPLPQTDCQAVISCDNRYVDRHIGDPCNELSHDPSEVTPTDKASSSFLVFYFLCPKIWIVSKVLTFCDCKFRIFFRAVRRNRHFTTYYHSVMLPQRTLDGAGGQLCF